MAEYKITITIDEGQDKILKSEALARGKTEEELLGALSSSITDQIDSWVNGQITAKMNDLTPAEVLSRLEYFDT